MPPEQLQQFQKAIASALSKHPDVIRYGGTNSPDALVNAYMTNDWSNLTNLTGKPFTRAQQEQAVSAAERALAPAFKAQEAYDTSVVSDALAAEQGNVNQFRANEKQAFGAQKDTLDQSAADQGVLFSGSRFQKLNDLRKTYADREAQNVISSQNRIQNTARDFQYKYGDTAAKGLSDLYKLPDSSNFNANVAGGKVTPSSTMSSAYNTDRFKFQGTAPVSQKASIQTRAASLLGNKANKLSAYGYKTQL